jgi:hypothetical protein
MLMINTSLVLKRKFDREAAPGAKWPALGAATAEPRRVFSGKTCGCANALLRAVVLWKTLLAGKRELINISSF